MAQRLGVTRRAVARRTRKSFSEHDQALSVQRASRRTPFCIFGYALAVVANIGVARQTRAASTLLECLRFGLVHRTTKADEVRSTVTRTEDLGVEAAIASIDAGGLRLCL